MTKIAINAGIAPGVVGGTANFLLGLMHGLGKLEDGNEEYVFIGTPENIDILNKYAASNQHIICLGDNPPHESKHEVKPGIRARLAGRVRQRFHRFLFPPGPTVGASNPSMRWIDIPVSNGFYEGLGCDLIHFPYQGFTLCALPSIYQPWDLQHLHYPSFFRPMDIAWRETIFRAGCEYSTQVVVASQWIKQDVIRAYGIHADKIKIVPVAPPTLAESISDPASVRTRYSLPEQFIFYPAVTWPHKNHVRLLEAMALLRQRDGLTLHLVCTGAQTEYWETIRQRVIELELESQVLFLGLIPASDLRALYRLSEFVVFPSLFEGAGMPPLEAWAEEKPVTCSNAASLPDIVGDAALLFDPQSVLSIADAVREMATNTQLCEHYRQQGIIHVRNYSWERTAKIYRALYRKMLGTGLSEEDQGLLNCT
jgi:glycosyltransferase involved in cell wall biosynthesis